MRKITYKSRCLWLLAAVFWMLLIFHFSDQKAVVSGKTSGRLTGRIAEGINEVFHLDWEKDTVEAFAEQLEHPVRSALRGIERRTDRQYGSMCRAVACLGRYLHS